MWATTAVFKFIGDNISPLATIVVCATIVFFIVLFRGELRGLLNRLWAQPAPESPEQPPLPQRELPVSQSVAATEILQPDTKEAEQVANRIRQIFTAQTWPDGRKIENLIVMCANISTRFDFGVMYRTIYGSQLEALLALRKDGPQAIGKYHDAFIDRVKSRWPDALPPGAKLDFETWVGWLANIPIPYVTIEGGIASITPRGDAFLTYLSFAAISPDRPF
jgi:hypothetical protein